MYSTQTGTHSSLCPYLMYSTQTSTYSSLCPCLMYSTQTSTHSSLCPYLMYSTQTSTYSSLCPTSCTIHRLLFLPHVQYIKPYSSNKNVFFFYNCLNVTVTVINKHVYAHALCAKMELLSFVHIFTLFGRFLCF